jgi:hypothetical protein
MPAHLEAEWVLLTLVGAVFGVLVVLCMTGP